MLRVSMGVCNDASSKIIMFLNQHLHVLDCFHFQTKLETGCTGALVNWLTNQRESNNRFNRFYFGYIHVSASTDWFLFYSL